MTAVDNLKALGYDVVINEDKIKLSYKGEGTPDENIVRPLLDELEANKSEIIKGLQKSINISDEILQDLFLETMNKINNEYLAGTIKYIKERHKDLDSEINKADGRINEVWEKCNNGEANSGQFKVALDSYEKLYLEGIDLYKKTQKVT
jgi:hypothetical protein